MFNAAVILVTAFACFCQVSAIVVDSSTDCDYFATRTTLNSTHDECNCESDYTGNGSICALLAQLDCKSDIKDGFAFKVSLNQSYIDFYNYSQGSLALLNASCSGAVLEDGYYVLTSPTYDDCGTIRTNTSDEIVYSNAVTSNGGSVSTGDILRLPFSCMVVAFLSISLGDENDTSPLVLEQTAASQIVFPVSGGAGSVSAQMYVYEDEGYANQHSGIPILKSKDMLYAEIALEHRIDALTLIARQCWATPEVTGTSSQRFNIIEEPGCLNTAALNAKLTSNGVMWYTRFEFQVFTFLPENIAFIHCDIELCNPSDGRSCQPTCGASGRRRRSTNVRRLHSSAILRAKEPEPPIFRPVATTPDDQHHESDGIDMMLVVLVVVAALLMVIVVALVVYICRTRKKKSPKAFKGDPLPKAHVPI